MDIVASEVVLIWIYGYDKKGGVRKEDILEGSLGRFCRRSWGFRRRGGCWGFEVDGFCFLCEGSCSSEGLVWSGRLEAAGDLAGCAHCGVSFAWADDSEMLGLKAAVLDRLVPRPISFRGGIVILVKEVLEICESRVDWSRGRVGIVSRAGQSRKFCYR